MFPDFARHRMDGGIQKSAGHRIGERSENLERNGVTDMLLIANLLQPSKCHADGK
jgi:hypothetical protein